MTNQGNQRLGKWEIPIWPSATSTAPQLNQSERIKLTDRYGSPVKSAVLFIKSKRAVAGTSKNLDFVIFFWFYTVVYISIVIKLAK